MSTDLVETWLRRHCGLEAASLGPGVVARAVRARLDRLGLTSSADYLDRLVNFPAERQELIDRVVVAETWFFRDRAALDAVARYAVDTWGPANPGAIFRVLCVPCSTGEEAYSIAMAFAQVGWPVDRLLIEALDISHDNVVRAREGVYRKNSFRSADLGFRDEFLEPVGAELWRVRERVRVPVAFAEANVLAPDFSHGRGFYDAIFCRNLLIYFDRAIQNRVILTLGALLARGGLFAVGPAEPVLLFEHGYSALKIPAAFLLQRRPPAPVTVAPAPSPPRPRLAPLPLLKTTVPPPLRVMSSPVQVMPPSRSTDTLAAIQALADAGQLGEAAKRGTALLASGPTAELLYLLGVIADASGDPVRATELYRKTIYLDPQHADALTQLAFHAEKTGDLRTARTLRARVERTLGREKPVA